MAYSNVCPWSSDSKQFPIRDTFDASNAVGIDDAANNRHFLISRLGTCLRLQLWTMKSPIENSKPRPFPGALKNGCHLCVVSTMHSFSKASPCFFDTASQSGMGSRTPVAHCIPVSIAVRDVNSAYNLYFFLQATGHSPNVNSLRYRYTQAHILGPPLLRDCTGLREVSLTFYTNDFPFLSHRQGNTKSSPPVLDRKSFVEYYSFRQLLDLKRLEKVMMPPAAILQHHTLCSALTAFKHTANVAPKLDLHLRRSRAWLHEPSWPGLLRNSALAGEEVPPSPTYGPSSKSTDLVHGAPANIPRPAYYEVRGSSGHDSAHKLAVLVIWSSSSTGFKNHAGVHVSHRTSLSSNSELASC